MRAGLTGAVAEFNGERGVAASFRRARPAAVEPELPARVVARRGGGDQLPPLLRHQRSGSRAHGIARGLRACPCALVPLDRRPARQRVAPRSHGRPLRPASVLRRVAATFHAGPARARSRTGRQRAPLADPGREGARQGRSAAHDVPVDGTTGYDFTAAVQGLWVDPQAETAMTALYRRFTGDQRTSPSTVYEAKRLVLEHGMVSEITMLAGRLQRLALGHRSYRDFTLMSLTQVIKEVIAAFPVYRTYLREQPEPHDHDEHLIRVAVRLARRRNPALDPSIFDFVSGSCSPSPPRAASSAIRTSSRCRFSSSPARSWREPSRIRLFTATRGSRASTRLAPNRALRPQPARFSRQQRSARPGLAARDAHHLNARHEAR